MSQAPSIAPLLILAGPTACGKSDIALELAPALNADIVAADSMQVYRGLDILSAKPSPADRARIPHHGLDLAEITEDYTVARWLAAATEAIADIRARGRIPLVVGGTGLYLRALRFGLDRRPPTPPELRSAFTALSLDDLVADLRARDPAAADRVDLRNRRRVERALAVALQAPAPPPARTWDQEPLPARLIVVRRERDDLRARIARRVDQMFRAGVVDEFRALRAAGLSHGNTAWQAIGCHELEDRLTNRCTESDARERIAAATRQYAKRQATWLRREAGAEWIELSPAEVPAQAAGRILALLSRQG